MRELGDQLRKIRDTRGWTRKELGRRLRKLGLRVSLQTLATWELGTRAISAVNLYLVCLALDVPMYVVVRQTVEEIRPPTIDDPGLTVTINLASLANAAAPELAPARQWAATIHAEQVTLDAHALLPLVELCGISPAALLDAIRDVRAR